MTNDRIGPPYPNQFFEQECPTLAGHKSLKCHRTTSLAHQRHLQANGVAIVKTVIKHLALTKAANLSQLAAQHGS
jgi:hypothetical protein